MVVRDAMVPADKLVRSRNRLAAAVDKVADSGLLPLVLFSILRGILSTDISYGSAQEFFGVECLDDEARLLLLPSVSSNRLDLLQSHDLCVASFKYIV